MHGVALVSEHYKSSGLDLVGKSCTTHVLMLTTKSTKAYIVGVNKDEEPDYGARGYHILCPPKSAYNDILLRIILCFPTKTNLKIAYLFAYHLSRADVR